MHRKVFNEAHELARTDDVMRLITRLNYMGLDALATALGLSPGEVALVAHRWLDVAKENEDD